MREPPQLPLLERVTLRRAAKELPRELQSLLGDGTPLPAELSHLFAALPPRMPTARSVLGEAGVTAGSVLGPELATVRSLLGHGAETMQSPLWHTTTRSLLRGVGDLARGPDHEADAVGNHAAQFRAERPRRDPRRAEVIARAWQRQWGTAIEDDRLAVAVSAVPAQRLRDAAGFITKVPGLQELVSQLDAWASTTANGDGTAVPGSDHIASRVARLRDTVRQVVHPLWPLDASAVAKITSHPERWWREQRSRCADAAYAWCVERRRRPRRGLWQNIAEVLWYHGWDVDPGQRDDITRLKMQWSRSRRSRRTPTASTPGGASR